MIRILLTAAIRPQSNYRLSLTDPNERSKQYASALLEWCDWAKGRDDTTIVFIENSGADLLEFSNEVLGSVPSYLDLVSVPVPPPEVVARGKGASECLMLDAFADRYRDDPDETLWVKVTGRLFVSNMSSILPLQVTKNTVLARLSLGMHHVDARIFGATAACWRRVFVGMGSDVREAEDRRLEHVLAQRVCLGVGQGADLFRFQRQPIIQGISGTWHGRNYGGIRSAIKRQAAEVLDYILREKLRNKHV